MLFLLTYELLLIINFCIIGYDKKKYRKPTRIDKVLNKVDDALDTIGEVVTSITPEFWKAADDKTKISYSFSALGVVFMISSVFSAGFNENPSCEELIYDDIFLCQTDECRIDFMKNAGMCSMSLFAEGIKFPLKLIELHDISVISPANASQENMNPSH